MWGVGGVQTVSYDFDAYKTLPLKTGPRAASHAPRPRAKPQSPNLADARQYVKKERAPGVGGHIED